MGERASWCLPKQKLARTPGHVQGVLYVCVYAEYCMCTVYTYGHTYEEAPGVCARGPARRVRRQRHEPFTRLCENPSALLV